MKYVLTSVIRPAHLMFVVLTLLDAATGFVGSNQALAESGIAPSRQSVSPPQEFEGKCRGFRESQTVGMLVAPTAEIEKLVEGEGAVFCKLVPGSTSAIRIINGCPEEKPCEVDGRFIAHGQDVDVLGLTTVRSWDGWRSTCYGAVSSLGDGIFSVGVTEGETSSGLKRTVRCDFFSEIVAKRILSECPEGSICEVRGRVEKQPEIDILSKDSPMAVIGYVDSVQRKDPPVKAAAPMESPRITSDGSAALALCSSRGRSSFSNDTR